MLSMCTIPPHPAAFSAGLERLPLLYFWEFGLRTYYLMVIVLPVASDNCLSTSATNGDQVLLQSVSLLTALLLTFEHQNLLFNRNRNQAVALLSCRVHTPLVAAFGLSNLVWKPVGILINAVDKMKKTITTRCKIIMFVQVWPRISTELKEDSR